MSHFCHVCGKTFIRTSVFDSHECHQLETECGYLYLIREKEFVLLNQPTYKVGMTIQKPDIRITRIGKYKKGSKLTLLKKVPSHLTQALEKQVIDEFKIFFTQHPKGREFFTGDENAMVNIICDITRASVHSTQQVDQYEVVKTFVHECIRDNPNSSVSRSAVYERFREWCRCNASWIKPKKSTFFAQMTLQLGESIRSQWEGKELLSEEDSEKMIVNTTICDDFRQVVREPGCRLDVDSMGDASRILPSHFYIWSRQGNPPLCESSLVKRAVARCVSVVSQ